MRVTLLLAAANVALSVAVTPATAQQPLSPAQIYELRVEADAAYDAGRYTEAAPLYEQIATANPRDGEAMFRWARGLFVAGDAPRALELGQRAGGMGFGNSARASLAIARGMAGAGDTEAALEWLDAALFHKLEERPALKSDEAFAAMRDDPQFRKLAGFPAVETADRRERWHRDLEFFLEEAQRLHADPDRIAHSKPFTDQVLGLADRVDELDDVAIAMELQRIIATLGDGHSVLYPIPTESVRFPLPLPVSFYFFSDGLYIVDADGPHRDLIGQRVVAIGGKSIDNVVDDLRPFVSRDNDQGIFWLGPFYLKNTPTLRVMGYTDQLGGAVVTLEGANGSYTTLTCRRKEGRTTTPDCVHRKELTSKRRVGFATSIGTTVLNHFMTGVRYTLSSIVFGTPRTSRSLSLPPQYKPRSRLLARRTSFLICVTTTVETIFSSGRSSGWSCGTRRRIPTIECG